MTWPESLLNPGIVEMEAYVPGKPIEELQRELGLESIVKMASNENPLGPSPKAIEALRQGLEELRLYPDGSYHDFRQALAERVGLTQDHIHVGDGAAELIYIVGLTFLGEGDETIVGVPSFPTYEWITRIMRGHCVHSPLREYTTDLEDMVNRITPRTKLIFLCNPNNPTGTSVKGEAFYSFLEKVPPEVFIVADEAYIDFVRSPDFPDTVSSLKSGQRNLVILRTLSKALGLAGLRIGYVMAHPSVIGALNRVRLPFNVSRAAQIAAVAGLEDSDHLRRTLDLVNRGKDFLYGRLAEMGLEFVPSDSNFILVGVERLGSEVFEALLQRGVIVRPAFGMSHHIRVTIGTEHENRRFVEALREVLDAGVRS
jgi:histidinol-phosphate aminotransferase